jgi:hypothetical protein
MTDEYWECEKCYKEDLKYGEDDCFKLNGECVCQNCYEKAIDNANYLLEDR